MEKLASQAEAFLEQTAPAYKRHLAEWSARDLPTSQTGGGLTYADSLFFERMARFDLLFPARSLPKTYREAMANLGIRVEQQQNIVIIEDHAQSPMCERADCFAFSPPNDVRLASGIAAVGFSYYTTFFEAAARAQYYGWASREMAARYPEFIFAPDSATRSGYSALFFNFFLDARWLMEHAALTERDARHVARSGALLATLQARRNCAALLREIAQQGQSSATSRSEHPAEAFDTLYREATGFRYPSAAHLPAGSDAAPSAASSLRAAAFAASLGERLMTRYGHRWWAQRSAGDELIDIWNTASRYRAEELLRLTGAGELDFELLADKLITGMRGE